MLKIVIRRVIPDKELKLRDWLAELNSRSDEVRATFECETTRGEMAYIVPGEDGPLLIYAMEAEGFEQAAKAYFNSDHGIDSEHRALMDECLGDSLGLSPLYNVRLHS